MRRKYSIVLSNISSIEEFLNIMRVSSKKKAELNVNKSIMVNGRYIPYQQEMPKKSILNFDYEEELNYQEEYKTLDILYEDDYLLIVNKPVGIIIHGEKNSLANCVAGYLHTKVYFPHRLDYETSGVMIFCKHFFIESYFDYLFREDKITKKYIAYVSNPFLSLSGIIDKPIGTDRHRNNKMVIAKNGLRSITKYQVLENKEISKLEIELKTGRTHQIRVHLASINHPIIGDTIYGNNKHYRLMLHAEKIIFLHPITNELIEVIAPMDEKSSQM